MDEAIDTETLLAILSSLVYDTEISQSVLLNALIASNGDVEAAAIALKSRTTASNSALRPIIEPSIVSASRGAKRKRSAGLDAWLKGSRCESPSFRHEDSPPRLRAFSHKFSPIKSTSSSSTSSSQKPVVDLMTVLKDTSSANTGPARMPPLTLGSPALVSQHTPCTLHYRVLPIELASSLFHTMLDEAEKWQRNEWWLFDRLVTSPHRTSLYTRQDTDAPEGTAWVDAANGWSVISKGLPSYCISISTYFRYNGRRTQPPLSFPAIMETACRVIEEIVNIELKKRKREPLEWAGDNMIWRANMAGANCYEGAQESVGSVRMLLSFEYECDPSHFRFSIQILYISTFFFDKQTLIENTSLLI